MTNSPTFTHPHSTGNENGGLIYATEFETSTYGAGASFKTLNNYEAKCAVCHVLNRATVLMHPGTDVCPAGWTREYMGILMTSHFTHHRSEYVCVDADAERHGSAGNHDGALFYPVEVQCSDNVPCGPFMHDVEAACAVCTR